MKSIQLLLFMGFCSLASYGNTSHLIEAEVGAVWQAKNDVQVPPSGGTYLEFDKFNPGPFPHLRLNGDINWDGPHGLRYVLAPFRISLTGRAPTDTVYRGETFDKDQDLTINYMFDSYRVGYTYSYFQDENQRFRFGATGKIRSAEIEFVQGSKKASKQNVGFVPLFYMSYERALSSEWFLFSDMDFAAAPQGRAFDFAFKVKKGAPGNNNWGLGYRTLEGGADNDEVVTWSWFHYVFLDYQVVI